VGSSATKVGTTSLRWGPTSEVLKLFGRRACGGV